MIRLRRALDRWQPQVVHVHENLDPRLLALTTGYRTVFTVHDPVEHLGARQFTRTEKWIVKRWLRRSERFVVHGQALADELAPRVGSARIVVIPHGTWPRPEPLSPPHSPSVLLFGRLEPYKGVEVLVEAMRLVWERRPDVRLVVAGTGRAARLVPADPRISLRATYISEDEVERLLARASLVVLPYTQASQSGVGLLAVGNGIPVVVSNLGALPDLAYNPSFVCEHGDPRELAEAIIRHVDDGLDVRQDVLAHARSHFSWERAAALTTRLYEDLLGDSELSESPAAAAAETSDIA
jgi:glycosyltransferase involved in cell wall biosynthesis